MVNLPLASLSVDVEVRKRVVEVHALVRTQITAQQRCVGSEYCRHLQKPRSDAVQIW